MHREGKYLSNGIEYREYYPSGEHKAYNYKYAPSPNDTIFYYKEYDRNGQITRFWIPVLVQNKDDGVKLELRHTFVPDSLIEVCFMLTDSVDLGEAIKVDNKICSYGTSLSISKSQIAKYGTKGFFVEKIRNNDFPFGYRYISLVDSTINYSQ